MIKLLIVLLPPILSIAMPFIIYDWAVDHRNRELLLVIIPMAGIVWFFFVGMMVFPSQEPQFLRSQSQRSSSSQPSQPSESSYQHGLIDDNISPSTPGHIILEPDQPAIIYRPVSQESSYSFGWQGEGFGLHINGDE